MKDNTQFSEQLIVKLRKAYEEDGSASFYVTFEQWCKIRSTAKLIIMTHEDE